VYLVNIEHHRKY